MPIVRVEMLEGRSQSTKQKIANEMTDVLVRNLGTDPAHIYIMFSDVAGSDWAVGRTFFESSVAGVESDTASKPREQSN